MLLDETRVRVSLSPMFLGETPPPYGPMSCCAHSRTKGRFFCSSAVVNRLPLRAHKEKNALRAGPGAFTASPRGAGFLSSATDERAFVVATVSQPNAPPQRGSEGKRKRSYVLNLDERGLRV